VVAPSCAPPDRAWRDGQCDRGLVDRAREPQRPAQREPDRPNPVRTRSGGLVRLQRLAGNRAVANAVVQRLAGAHRTLRSGSTGTDVEELQAKLNQLNTTAEPLKVDSIFGPLTRQAVVQFQSTHDLDPDGVVGKLTWAALDAGGETPPPPPPPPVLQIGSTGAAVAQAQQKLNAAGSGLALLDINGVYDTLMAGVVFEFQLINGLTPTGSLDAASLAALDAQVPGGGVGADGIENAVNNPNGANALGTQDAGTSLHPVVGPGQVTSGPAVLEAEQKLNIWNATRDTPDPAVAEDSSWGGADTALLTAFQTAHSLPTGPLNAASWTALDAAAPNARSGFEARSWKEIVGGHQYGMTSRYQWALASTGAGDVMNVTAVVNFTGNPPSPAWAGFVTAAWNKFAAEEATTKEKVNIDFALAQGSGGNANTVKVSTGTGRANGGNWFLGDTKAASTVPHEYGHLLGLSDEYQLHAGDYRTVTGHEPTVGDADGPAGVTAAQMAQNIQTKMVTLDPAQVAAVSTGLGLKSGAYAQQVLEAYSALPAVTLPALPTIPASGSTPAIPGRPAMQTTGRLVEDLDVGLRDDATGNRYNVIQALTYSSGSLMGDPGRVTDHDHGGAQPRHVQEFCDHIAAIRGGSWQVVNR